MQKAIEEHTWLFLASVMIVLRIPRYLVIGFRDRYNGLGMHLITGEVLATAFSAYSSTSLYGDAE